MRCRISLGNGTGQPIHTCLNGCIHCSSRGIVIVYPGTKVGQVYRKSIQACFVICYFCVQGAILSGYGIIFTADIGKLQLPYELLWKPGKLTEEEFKIIKTHPVVGYTSVRNQDLNEHVKNAVIMHHERLDGSGYPYHMSGQKIDVYARYMAIIDAYIAMASPRTYRNALTPLQILGNFEKSLDKYDVDLLMPIMKRIADAQIGTNVQLNDGSVWEVLIIHPNKFSRPILKNEKNEFVDLLQRTDLEIVKNV